MFLVKILKNHKLLFRFALSNIVVLIITITIGSIAYYESYKLLQTNYKTTNMSMLNQIINQLDKRFQEINNMTI
ncbi:MAG: hypothetical protein ABF289_20315, partial [Clostridiales bacterium]